MVGVHLQPDLTPWKPTSTQVPGEWMSLANKLAEEAKGFPHEYVLKVRYDAQGVGDLLRSWGLPWQVVMAGYLWEYDKRQIQDSKLDGLEEVLRHINEAALYVHYIENENLPPLLTPPYRDLGALLIAIAIYYQALKNLQQQSNGRFYTEKMLSNIESVGSTLLNITKRLGMWHFKREVEDLMQQLRSPEKFLEYKQELEDILEQDASLMKEIGRLLTASYQEATGRPIVVVYTPCGIAGFRRRLQDAHTTATSRKTELTSFDLATFDVIVSTVQECYAAFGVLSQLGYIQDRVTDLIANPKSNGCSHIALGLVLKPQGQYLRGLMLITSIHVCQLQIATHLMQAIVNYGCLQSDLYQLYTMLDLLEEIKLSSAKQFWNSREGKVYYTIKSTLVSGGSQSETSAPIVVYDKSRKPIALPKNATALDFAYVFGNEIGMHAEGAIINNRKAPLYRMLEAGDVVEIRMRDVQAVDESSATTPMAKQGIKESVDRLFLDRRGYRLLRQELERYHYMLTWEELDEELRLLLKQYNLGALQVYLERIGKEEKPPYTLDWAAREIMQQIDDRNEPILANQGRSIWIPVLDIQLTTHSKGSYQQRLCGLCRPSYPRDMKILGRLRKRSGELIVHRDTCSHLIDRPLGQYSVLIPMSWQLLPPAFIVAFSVMVQDRRGLILDLTRQLRRHQCDLMTINAEAVNPKTGVGHVHFTIETHSEKEVLEIWEELYKIENVIEVVIDGAKTLVRIRERLEKLRELHATLSTKTVIEFTWEESVSTLQPRSQVLMNPFDISRPASAKMFFGRSEEIKKMQRELCDDEKGKALILYGPRRSGKSSICKNFLERQVQPPYWSVLFSLQNAISLTEEAILMQLADRVSTAFHEQLYQLAPQWEQYNDNDPQIRFRRLVQDCIAQVPGARLVLALDEFGGALESYEKHILGFRFFTYWKDLMAEIPQLSLIFVLPTSAHRRLSSKRFSNALSFAQNLPVMFLDTESAKRLLGDPLEDLHIAIHPNTVALAVTLSGGNPYYMTLIGQQLIQHLNRDPHKQVVTDTDLRLVVEQFIESGSPQNFDFLKSELQSKDEFRILETMIDFISHSNQLEIQLRKIAGLVKLPIPVARRHLDRLRNGLILDENGPPSNPFYSFKIDLVRRWLIRNRWFFS